MNEIYHSLSTALYTTIYWEITLFALGKLNKPLKGLLPQSIATNKGNDFKGITQMEHLYPRDAQRHGIVVTVKQKHHRSAWCSTSSCNIILNQYHFLYFYSYSTGEERQTGNKNGLLFMGIIVFSLVWELLRYICSPCNDNQCYSNEDQEHVLEEWIEPVLVLCGNK